MVGFGYDIHRLGKGESLILGGITIESELGTIAHSDGDVLIHALIDSILGAAGLGDIGEFFPDNDMAYRGISSTILLGRTLDLIRDKYRLINIDAMIILEKPKLKEYKNRIRENLSILLGIPQERVNIKAGTNEKLDALGRNEAIAVNCVCMIEEIK